MNSPACPALVDLFQEALPEPIEIHLATCPRCRALLRAQGERIIGGSEEIEILERIRHPNVVPGDVVLIDALESDELLVAVVAKVGSDAVTVVPLSERIDLASEWDMLLERDVLGYEAMAETWNYGHALPEQLVETVAQLAEQRWEELRALLTVVAAGGERPESAVVGARIISAADPRLVFQDEESERLRPYWEPTLALAGAATLGQLVTHRREELGVAQADLAQLSLHPGWVEDFERDALDIERVLEPTALASLMRRLRIGRSDRLGRLALATVVAFRGEQGMPTGTAFARRRASSGWTDADRSPEDYVAEFLEALTEE